MSFAPFRPLIPLLPLATRRLRQGGTDPDRHAKMLAQMAAEDRIMARFFSFVLTALGIIVLVGALVAFFGHFQVRSYKTPAQPEKVTVPHG